MTMINRGFSLSNDQSSALLRGLEEHKVPVSVTALGLVYGFGILGMFTPFQPWFVALTPLSLLLSYGLLWWNHPVFDAGSRNFLLAAFLVGFGAEVVGVNTGFPFGTYFYGTVLGPQLWNTPILIGINWTLVTYCSNEVLRRVSPAWSPKWALVLLGALLPTLLDVLIEPVAIRLVFWSWAGGMPPIQNYIGWFAVSLIISLAYHFWMPGRLRNPVAAVLLGLQWLFFAVLQAL
jgi:putative membrane protein